MVVVVGCCRWNLVHRVFSTGAFPEALKVPNKVAQGRAKRRPGLGATQKTPACKGRQEAPRGNFLAAFRGRTCRVGYSWVGCGFWLHPCRVLTAQTTGSSRYFSVSPGRETGSRRLGKIMQTFMSNYGVC